MRRMGLRLAVVCLTWTAAHAATAQDRSHVGAHGIGKKQRRNSLSPTPRLLPDLECMHAGNKACAQRPAASESSVNA